MIPYSSPFPWRRALSTDFAESTIVPICFGRVTLRPIAYSTDRKTFRLAAHYCAGVDLVERVEGSVRAATEGYEFENALDEAGEPMAFLTLADPLTDAEVLVVTLRGVIEPRSGALLTNPADAIDYLRREWLGDESGGYGDLATLRLRADALGLAVNGRFGDERTVRQLLDELLGQYRIGWHPDARAFGYFLDDDPNVYGFNAASVDALNATQVTAESSIDTFYTSITVRYGFNDAAGEYTGSVRVTAPDLDAATPRPAPLLDLPAIATAREAQTVAERFLANAARPQYLGRAIVRSARDVRPGDTITDSYPGQPFSARAWVEASNAALPVDEYLIEYRAAVGDVPRLRTDRQTTRFIVEELRTVVVLEGDVLVVNALDADGVPLTAGSVTVNDVTKPVDASGQARFAGGPGAYTITITGPDGGTATTELVL